MPEPSIAVPPPPPDPLLTRASVTFHTMDQDKDNNTFVEVKVRLMDQRTVVAKLSDFLGHFDENSDAGPFTLVMIHPAPRSQLRTGNVDISAFQTLGRDTWRFNFVVDLLFDDGAHLLARANGVRLKSSDNTVEQSFGIE